jgi:hypothetical protein
VGEATNLLHVVRAAVGGDELLRLDPVEGGGGLQEGLLEILLVDRTAVDPEVDEHLGDALDGLPGPLLVDEGQDHLEDPVLDPRCPRDVVTEKHEAKIVDGGHVVVHDVNSVLDRLRRKGAFTMYIKMSRIMSIEIL